MGGHCIIIVTFTNKPLSPQCMNYLPIKIDSFTGDAESDTGDSVERK